MLWSPAMFAQHRGSPPALCYDANSHRQTARRPTLPACRIRLEFRIVSGREAGRAVSKLLQAHKRRWEITDHQVAAGKRHVLVWYRVPSNDALDATGGRPGE